MPAPRKKSWDTTLREVIKTEHGFGWSIRGHRDKVQLTRRHDDGTRSSVSLDLPWNASSQTEVVRALGEIRQRMDAQGLGLAEAYALIRNAPTAETGRLDWAVVVEQFMASREGRRATTLRDLRTRMDLPCRCCRASRAPRTAAP